MVLTAQIKEMRRCSTEQPGPVPLELCDPVLWTQREGIPRRHILRRVSPV